MNYVIVGTGVAGIAAAESIRSIDAAGAITLIGDDPHGYYSRPGLAYYLSGEVNEKQLFPYRADELRQLRVQHIKGLVARLTPTAHQLQMQDGSIIAYDRLLLATGAHAAPLHVPGAGLPEVVKLDHLEDARAILKRAGRGKTAVVVGGGITALEIVEACWRGAPGFITSCAPSATGAAFSTRGSPILWSGAWFRKAWRSTTTPSLRRLRATLTSNRPVSETGPCCVATWSRTPSGLFRVWNSPARRAWP